MQRKGKQQSSSFSGKENSMASGPRAYSDKTLKRLFALSGNLCAFPGCHQLMVNEKNAKDSNICHIEAANPDGERYNIHMTDEQRADYNNLILLCVQHHDETNDVKKYTVDVLKQMKKDHESQHLNDRMKRNPSMLENTINALSKIDLLNYPESPALKIVDPNLKIKHNCLKRNSALIKEYKIYHTKLNSLYTELENQGSIVKEKLLKNIELVYGLVKGRYVLDSENPLRKVQSNSDDIFDEVYLALYEKLEQSGFWDEDIVLGIRIIMVDAFIRCKILEEP